MVGLISIASPDSRVVFPLQDCSQSIMADEIANKCEDLRIIDDESKIVAFDDEPDDNEDSSINQPIKCR